MQINLSLAMILSLLGIGAVIVAALKYLISAEFNNFKKELAKEFLRVDVANMQYTSVNVHLQGLRDLIHGVERRIGHLERMMENHND